MYSFGFAEMLASNNRVILSQKYTTASLGMVSADNLRPRPECEIA